MEMELYLLHVVPFILLFYLAFLFFLRPPRAVIQAALLGGLLMAIINAVADLLAYYVHLWHYAIDGLVLHLPLPFYITPILIYGGIVYLLVWRFWQPRAGAFPAPQAGSLSPRQESSPWGGQHPAPTVEGKGDPRGRPVSWPALLLLIGAPLFGILRDAYGSAIAHSTYLVWDSILAGPADVVTWLLMFYAGFFVFKRLVPGRVEMMVNQ